MTSAARDEPRSGTAPLSWSEANQRHLTAAVSHLRWQLETHLAMRDGLESPTAPPPFQFEGAALEGVVRLFGLSPFERDLLLLSAASELDSAFAALIGKLNNDSQRGFKQRISRPGRQVRQDFLRALSPNAEAGKRVALHNGLWA